MVPIQAGTTNVSVVIRIIDSTDGTPETGVQHNTTGIDMWYRREVDPGSTPVGVTSITEVALAALTTAHTDGGIEHINHGYYRLDIPDAAFAAGAHGVMIGGTVTGMIVIGVYVPLVDYDPQDAVRLGLTALPNAAADAAGGLPISDAGGLDLDAMNTNINDIETDTNELQTDWANGGRLDLILDAVALEATVAALNDISAAQVNAEVDTALSDYDGPTNAEMQARTLVAASYATAANQTTLLNRIGAFTGSGVNTILGFFQAAMRSDATTPSDLGGTYDDATDSLQAISDSGGGGPTAAQIADAVWDEAQSGHSTAGTFGEIATEIASILADTNELQTDDVPGLIAALNDPTVAAIADQVWDELQSGHTTAGSFGEIATEIASILADTNELQSDDVPGLIAALNDLSAAAVNAEVVDALATDTYAEPGQGAPAATASIAAKINYLYKAWRNRSTQTATQYSLYADDATTVDQKAPVSDDGTTADKNEVVSGP